jgi:hypothetical protein
MSLVEQLHNEHKARLARMSVCRPNPPQPKPVVVLVKQARAFKPINPEPFYRSMWFYDLISPKNIEPRSAPTVLSIREAVCKYFGVRIADLESNRRYWGLVHPRQCAFYLARYHTSFSFPQIGRRFGDRDHTTVLHGVRQIEKKMLADWRVAYDIAHLEAML